MDSTTQTIRIGYVEGLRGVAIVMIMVANWFMMGYMDPTSQSSSVFWKPWIQTTPMRIFFDSGLAIAIFFTLSGYVLTRPYLMEMKDSSNTMMLRRTVERYPRLLFPTVVGLLVCYSWLHFGPFQGYSACQEIYKVAYPPINWTVSEAFYQSFYHNVTKVHVVTNTSDAYQFGMLFANGLTLNSVGGNAASVVQWPLAYEFYYAMTIMMVAVVSHKISGWKRVAYYVVPMAVLSFAAVYMPTGWPPYSLPFYWGKTHTYIMRPVTDFICISVE
jgi:peptidoglycan/LPS O-acetylase OafA/YrhL